MYRLISLLSLSEICIYNCCLVMVYILQGSNVMMPLSRMSYPNYFKWSINNFVHWLFWRTLPAFIEAGVTKTLWTSIIIIKPNTEWCIWSSEDKEQDFVHSYMLVVKVCLYVFKTYYRNRLSQLISPVSAFKMAGNPFLSFTTMIIFVFCELVNFFVDPTLLPSTPTN